MIDDSDDDETDIERGSSYGEDGGDDVSDAHAITRMQQTVERILFITRTLEAVDDEHHRAWACVRQPLERLTGLVSNPVTRVCILQTLAYLCLIFS